MLQEPVPTEIKFYCHSCNGIVLSDYFDGRVECGHCEAACDVPKAFSEGVIIDDFAIIKRIGTGGMGSVYKAHQISLDRQVALKVLHGCFLEDLALKEEFIYEARSVASLNHKNIVQAYKVGEDCGVLFFAMEHVQGQDLSEYLKEIPRFDEGTVRAIGINIAAALGYAWDKCQLVHRDIKPENIMIAANGDVKLMDLGLSRKEGDDFDDEDRICGTLQYISPEQITGAEPVDNCSDIYSLGASLYQLITGKYLFNSADHVELLEMQMHTPAPSVRDEAPDVSESLERIIHKMVEKKKSKRYQDTQSLIADLGKVGEDAPVKMKLSVKKERRPVSHKVRAIKKDNTLKYTIWGLGFFLLVGIIVAMVIVRTPKKRKKLEVEKIKKVEKVEDTKEKVNLGGQLALEGGPVEKPPVKVKAGPITFSVINNPDLKWIWSPDATKVTFKKILILSKQPEVALLRVACNGSFSLSVNEEKVGESANWKTPLKLDIAKYLDTGANTFLIEAADTKNPAGFIFYLSVDGKEFISNKSWKAKKDLGKWTTATEVKAYGDAPWGKALDK